MDQADDVGMLQRRNGLDLAKEPLGTDHRGQLGAQDLDRDFAIVLEVLGQVDRGHAALAQLPFDAVAVGEGALQLRRRLGHRGLGLRMGGRWGERE